MGGLYSSRNGAEDEHVFLSNGFFGVGPRL